METIPIFVKEGSFIPMVKPVKSTDDYSTTELKLRYYPGKEGDSSFYNMFEDDGQTFGTIERSEYELLRFKATQKTDKNFFIEMVREGWYYPGMPKTRLIKLEIVSQSDEQNFQVKINGKKIKAKNEKASIPSYSFEKNYLVIEFEWDGSLSQVEINFK
jgi:oligosaccharide 4-alpha-D-glucosyltransferase